MRYAIDSGCLWGSETQRRKPALLQGAASPLKILLLSTNGASLLERVAPPMLGGRRSLLRPPRRQPLCDMKRNLEALLKVQAGIAVGLIVAMQVGLT